MKNDTLAYGYSLVELMVTLIIMGIIVSLALPSFIQWRGKVEANRIKTIMETTLRQAKAESFISRNNVLLCLTNLAGQCDKNGDNQLLLFLDKDTDKHYDIATDRLIHQQHLSLDYGTVHLRAGRRHHVKFFGDTGKPRGHFGHIKYCPDSLKSDLTYQISFNQQGIIKYKPNRSHNSGC